MKNLFLFSLLSLSLCIPRYSIKIDFSQFEKNLPKKKIGIQVIFCGKEIISNSPFLQFKDTINYKIEQFLMRKGVDVDAPLFEYLIYFKIDTFKIYSRPPQSVKSLGIITGSMGVAGLVMFTTGLMTFWGSGVVGPSEAVDRGITLMELGLILMTPPLFLNNIALSIQHDFKGILHCNVEIEKNDKIVFKKEYHIMIKKKAPGRELSNSSFVSQYLSDIFQKFLKELEKDLEIVLSEK